VSDDSNTSETETESSSEFKNGREAANLDKVVVAINMLFDRESVSISSTRRLLSTYLDILSRNFDLVEFGVVEIRQHALSDIERLLSRAIV
jgi:hypothetical protein